MIFLLDKPSAVLIAGGYFNNYSLSSIELISEEYKKNQIPNLPVPIGVSPSMFLHNETIMLCGGYPNNLGCLALMKGAWKYHSILNQKRSYASVATTKYTTFLFGGWESKDTYEYLPNNSSEWQVGKKKIPGGFWDGSAITVSPDEIWLIGGMYTYRRILSFDTRTHQFEELSLKLIHGRRDGHRCAFVPGTNSIIVTGGRDCDWNEMNLTEIINVDDKSITNVRSMNFERFHHGIGILTIDDEDRVAVFGGYDGTDVINCVEIFNQEKQQWEIPNFKLMKPRSQFGFITVKL